jgi:phospholipid transport system transporter-binding protein
MPIHSMAASATVDVVEAAPNRILVKGALTFDTARRAREAGLQILRASRSGDAISVDCSGVDHSDSAGLAVLLDWLANATAQGRGIQFSNLPAGIQAAAKISDVESMLSLQPAPAG